MPTSGEDEPELVRERVRVRVRTRNGVPVSVATDEARSGGRPGGRERVRSKVRVRRPRPGRGAGRGGSPTRRRVLLAVAAVPVLFVLVIVVQAVIALRALQAADDRVDDMLAAIADGDPSDVRGAAESFTALAGRARTQTSGPHWSLVGSLPVVGADARSLRTVAATTDAIATEVVPPLLDLSGTVSADSFQPVDNRFDLAVIAAAGAATEEVAAVLAVEVAPVVGLERGPLLGSTVERLQRSLIRTTTYADRLGRGLTMLPDLLGASGPRTYLAIFQNNAEFRATGGIPGAYGIITARNGRVEMTEQGDANQITGAEREPLPLTPVETQIFTSRMGAFAQSANLTPDFPRAADLLAQMWRRTSGQRVDGVVSADPVALGGILGATGPVEVDGITLGAANAAEILLRTVYEVEDDPAEQNDYYARVARRVFDVLAAGQGDAGVLLSSLVAAADQGRFLIWSRTDTEQGLLRETGLAGALDRISGTRPEIGLFLNDGTATKLDSYVTSRTDVRSVGCAAGRQRLEVTTTLRSDVPADAATSLPDSVRGFSEDGSVRTTVLAYAPPGAVWERSALDGETGAPATYVHDGHPVIARTVDLAPQATRRLTYTVIVSSDHPGDPLLRTTPGALTDGRGDVSDSTCEGALS